MSNANIIWHTVAHLANNVGLQINLMSTYFLLQRCLKLTKKKEPVKHYQKYLKQLKRVKKIACNVNSHATTDGASFITAYLTPLLTLDIFSCQRRPYEDVMEDEHLN